MARGGREDSEWDCLRVKLGYGQRVEVRDVSLVLQGVPESLSLVSIRLGTFSINSRQLSKRQNFKNILSFLESVLLFAKQFFVDTSFSCACDFL